MTDRGAPSSLSDLLLFELDEGPGVPPDHVVEVSSYVAALDHGLSRARGLPARESKRRNRVFVYDGYLDILSEGTEPL